MYWFLKSKTAYLNSLGRGATFKEISKSIVENIEILVPDLAAQKKIASILEKLQTILHLRRSQLSSLDTLVKARFVEMFGDPASNNKGWPIKSLGTLCAVGSSKRIYQNEQCSSGVPFWRISDLIEKINTGKTNCALFISKAQYKDLKDAGFVPVAGDILITSRGTLGRCYEVKPEDQFYFQDGMISWLSHYTNGITPLYLQYLFAMPGFRKQLNHLQAGSTVAYLSIAMLKQLLIMVPSAKVQKDFLAFVSRVEQAKTSIRQALTETQTLFDSLMQEYFG